MSRLQQTYFPYFYLTFLGGGFCFYLIDRKRGERGEEMQVGIKPQAAAVRTQPFVYGALSTKWATLHPTPDILVKGGCGLQIRGMKQAEKILSWAAMAPKLSIGYLYSKAGAVVPTLVTPPPPSNGSVHVMSEVKCKYFIVIKTEKEQSLNRKNRKVERKRSDRKVAEDERHDNLRVRRPVTVATALPMLYYSGGLKWSHISGWEWCILLMCCWLWLRIHVL